MHPNFVSQVREISIFCEDCKLAAPLGFSRGLGPRFHDHLLRHAFPWFFKVGFHSDCI